MDLDDEELEATKRLNRKLKIKKLEADLYEANNRINDLLDIAKQKDKIISAMAEDLKTPVNSKEWIIEYYKKRCEDAKN